MVATAVTRWTSAVHTVGYQSPLTQSPQTVMADVHVHMELVTGTGIGAIAADKPLQACLVCTTYISESLWILNVHGEVVCGYKIHLIH